MSMNIRMRITLSARIVSVLVLVSALLVRLVMLKPLKRDQEFRDVKFVKGAEDLRI